MLLSEVTVVKRIYDAEDEWYIVKGIRDTRYPELPMKVHAERVFTTRSVAQKEMLLLQRINDKCYAAKKLIGNPRNTYDLAEKLV